MNWSKSPRSERNGHLGSLYIFYSGVRRGVCAALRLPGDGARIFWGSVTDDNKLLFHRAFRTLRISPEGMRTVTNLSRCVWAGRGGGGGSWWEDKRQAWNWIPFFSTWLLPPGPARTAGRVMGDWLRLAESLTFPEVDKHGIKLSLHWGSPLCHSRWRDAAGRGKLGVARGGEGGGWAGHVYWTSAQPITVNHSTLAIVRILLSLSYRETIFTITEELYISNYYSLLLFATPTTVCCLHVYFIIDDQ